MNKRGGRRKTIRFVEQKERTDKGSYASTIRRERVETVCALNTLS